MWMVCRLVQDKIYLILTFGETRGAMRPHSDVQMQVSLDLDGIFLNMSY